MAKIVLDEVAGGYDLSKINDNFQKIEDELNNKVLYRDNPVGEPNAVQKDIDLNGKKLLNVHTLDVTSSFSIQGLDLLTEVTKAETAATNSQTSATQSAASATLSQDWATKTNAEVVAGQGYGAKKYAEDAAASATTAQTAAASINDATLVHKSGDETISDVKTFNTSPIVPTPAIGDNSGKAASTAFVKAEIPITTKGDILTRNSSSPVRKAVGSDGSRLEADSTQGDGLAWKITPSLDVHRNSVNQSIASSTETKIQFTTKTIDNNNTFDNTTNYRWTPNVGGKYYIKVVGKVLGCADQNFVIIRIKKNGTTISEEIRSASGAIDVSCATDKTVDMNGSTDYLEAFIFHSNAGSLNLSGASAFTYMTGFRVSA